MFSKVKYWVVGGVAATGTAIGAYFGMSEPEIGTQAWFDYKAKEIAEYQVQITNIKQMMRGVNDFNVLQSYKFSLDTTREECRNVLAYRNDIAKDQKIEELISNLCD